MKNQSVHQNHGKKRKGKEGERKKNTTKREMGKMAEKEKEEEGVDEVEMDRLMALEYHQKAQVVEASTYFWQFL